MLVLTRKANEQILIGDDIKITLVRVRGNSVRIGIEAPREVRVVRGELADRDDATMHSDAGVASWASGRPCSLIPSRRLAAIPSRPTKNRFRTRSRVTQQAESIEEHARIFVGRVRRPSS